MGITAISLPTTPPLGPIVPLKSIEYGILGDLILIYPKPSSIYFRKTIDPDNLCIFPSFHFIFHFIFHLILNYWGNMYLAVSIDLLRPLILQVESSGLCHATTRPSCSRVWVMGLQVLMPKPCMTKRASNPQYVRTPGPQFPS